MKEIDEDDFLDQIFGAEPDESDFTVEEPQTELILYHTDKVDIIIEKLNRCLAAFGINIAEDISDFYLNYNKYYIEEI
jgi:hypothetical protein